MAVLDPLKVVIDNYPEDQVEEFEAAQPSRSDPAMGTRKVPFSRELYIERDDFMEEPPKKFFRLAPGREVRLRYAYFITLRGSDQGCASGKIIELRCSYDPATRGGSAPDGRKVKGTIHWVSARHALEAEVRPLRPALLRPHPGSGAAATTASDLNPQSLQVLTGCRVEPALAEGRSGSRYQFERQGYFCADRRPFAEGMPVFNRTVTLRDSWAKAGEQGGGQK